MAAALSKAGARAAAIAGYKSFASPSLAYFLLSSFSNNLTNLYFARMNISGRLRCTDKKPAGTIQGPVKVSGLTAQM